MNRVVVLSEERVDYYYKELSFCTTSKEMSEWHTEEIYREPALELIANRKKKKKGTIKDNIIKNIFTNVNGVTSIILNPYTISVFFGIAFDTGKDIKELIVKILMDCLEGEFTVEYYEERSETDESEEDISSRVFPQE